MSKNKLAPTTTPYAFMQPLATQSLPLPQSNPQLIDPFDGVVPQQGYAGNSFLPMVTNPSAQQGVDLGLGDSIGNMFANGATNGINFLKNFGSAVGNKVSAIGGGIADYGNELGKQALGNFNGLDALGKLNLVGDTVGSFMGAYNSHKQANAMQKYYKHSMDMANKNYENQRTLTNEAMADRQRRRVERNSGAESQASYMGQWGV